MRPDRQLRLHVRRPKARFQFTTRAYFAVTLWFVAVFLAVRYAGEARFFLLVMLTLVAVATVYWKAGSIASLTAIFVGPAILMGVPICVMMPIGAVIALTSPDDESQEVKEYEPPVDMRGSFIVESALSRRILDMGGEYWLLLAPILWGLLLSVFVAFVRVVMLGLRRIAPPEPLAEHFAMRLVVDDPRQERWRGIVGGLAVGRAVLLLPWLVTALLGGAAWDLATRTMTFVDLPLLPLFVVGSGGAGPTDFFSPLGAAGRIVLVLLWTLPGMLLYAIAGLVLAGFLKHTRWLNRLARRYER